MCVTVCVCVVAHQDDMARAGLEGEQRLELARREGEERFETMKKEAEQLKCTLAQQAVQEEGLLSELDEARQKNEELKTSEESIVLKYSYVIKFFNRV